MYKKTIFLWLIFAAQTSFVAEQNIDLSIERNIQPIHPLFHQQITAEQIRRGHTINTPGSYYVSSPFVKLVSGDNPSTTVSINNNNDTTNGIIAITSSNVTLNLNGSMFLTDVASKVVVAIGKDLNNVTVKNGIIGKGSSTFDSGIIIGQNSTNVTLEDLTISGCSGAGGSNGAISFKGATSNTIKGTQLKNLNLSHNTTTALKMVYCENVTAENINANNNAISGGGSAIIIAIESSNGVVFNNSTITKNSSTTDFYGISATASSHFLTFNNLKITNNESSAGGSNSIIAGINCDGSVGGGNDLEEINIINCTISRNRGTSGTTGNQQAYGIYLNKVNLALIDNCMVIDNATKSSTNAATHSAGLKLSECDFCTVKNSSFIGNKSGSFASASTADATTELNIDSSMNVGAGIINIGGQGGNQPNKSNQFINCVCNYNGTQLAEPSPSTNYVDDYASKVRYSNSNALEVGAVNQWAQNTTFIDCTFNNNGITQHSDGLSWFVMGIGALNVTSAKKTHFIRCTANNNNYFGFCDSGSLHSSPVNSESYFTSCLAMTNGAQNAIATAHYSGAAPDLKRNCRVYFTATVATDTPPFLDLTFKSFITDLTNTSSHANISIRQV